jgi:hypothetical protein
MTYTATQKCRTPEQIIGHDRLTQLIFEGYAVVPREATDEMMNAGVETAGRTPRPHWPGAGRPGYGQIRETWRAMLAAANGEIVKTEDAK